MKKLLTLVMLVFVLSLTFAPLVYAAETTEYNEAELQALLTDAFDVYTEFYDIANDSSFDTDAKMIEVIENPMPEIEDYPYLFAKRIDEYAEWDKFVDVLESVFTNEVKDIFISNALVSEYQGNTYCCTILFHPHLQDLYLEYTAEDVILSLDDSFSVVSAADNKVLAEFKVFDWVEEHDVITFTVEYTKVSDGWRISGGSFFDEKLVNKYDSAPQTGFATYAYAAVAVVAAAGAVAIVKRRREFN